MLARSLPQVLLFSQKGLQTTSPKPLLMSKAPWHQTKSPLAGLRRCVKTGHMLCHLLSALDGWAAQEPSSYGQLAKHVRKPYERLINLRQAWSREKGKWRQFPTALLQEETSGEGPLGTPVCSALLWKVG